MVNIIKKIFNHFLTPFNLAKTKVYLFGFLTSLFLGNLVSIKILFKKDFVEILSEDNSPNYIALAILAVFLYMLFIDYKDSKRNRETEQKILSIISNPDIPNEIKKDLIKKIK